METCNKLNRMSRDLRFNGTQQTVKGNIKVKDVKFQLAQKADTFPQLLIAFTKFGILENETELFKIHDNIYIFSIGYLIERQNILNSNTNQIKLNDEYQSRKNKTTGHSLQLSSIVDSYKSRKSFQDYDSTNDNKQYNSVDSNENKKKYKNGIDYVQEQIKKKFTDQQTQIIQEKETNFNSNIQYYCQIQKTEESVSNYENIRNYKNSLSQQKVVKGLNYQSIQSLVDLQRKLKTYEEIIEEKEQQMNKLLKLNQSNQSKLQSIQIDYENILKKNTEQKTSIESQEKYIVRLKQQEIKYVKLLGTISEFIQKIKGQIQQKLERKQKQAWEKSSDIFQRPIQSARADYSNKIKPQQLFILNQKNESVWNTKLIELQNQLTETILLNQSIDDLISAAEFLELDSSFRYDFE